MIATAKCEEINGTAINVGIRPEDTEAKVRKKSPNAQTTDGDESDRGGGSSGLGICQQ